MDSQVISIPAEHKQAITDLALEANQDLENTGQENAAQAFNLGCSASLLPAAVSVVMIFILARANWVVAGVTAVLILLIVMALSNFAAFTAKNKGIQRRYQLHVQPEIERRLKFYDLTRLQFDRLADEVLPPEAALRKFLTLPEAETEEPTPEEASKTQE